MAARTASAQGLPPYCSMNGSAFNASQVRSSSGNPQLDGALIAELRHILDVFPINPGFKYIYDPQPNAFAVPDTMVQGTQGTVFFGLNLIQQEMQAAQYGGVAVAGISAHECGHIFQFFSGYAQRLSGATAMPMELHADYLAGYYMGKRKQFSTDRVSVFAQSVFNKGDYAFNDRSHHGTPEQRRSAMLAGYQAAANKGMSLNAAAQEGANLVGGL